MASDASGPGKDGKRQYPFSSQGMFDYALDRGADPWTAHGLAKRFYDRYQKTWREHFGEKFKAVGVGFLYLVLVGVFSIIFGVAYVSVEILVGKQALTVLVIGTFIVLGAITVYRLLTRRGPY